MALALFPKLFFATLLILGMWVSLTTSRALHDTSMKARHEQWTVRHGRAYKDDVEKEMRLKIFSDNVESIESFNNVGTHTYTLRINEFADMTKEEFKASRTGYKKSSHTKSSKTASFKYESVTVVPATMDWRKKGAVTPIKYERSCWAFAAVGAMEGINQLTTGHLISVSEQEIVDCDTGGWDNGCKGGETETALEFIIHNRGLTKESTYPYVASDGKCNVLKERSHVAKITGYEMVPANNESSLLLAVANQSIAVAIEADRLMFYDSGVYSGDCGTVLDHVVTAIGYGRTETGTKYWLLKNSKMSTEDLQDLIREYPLPEGWYARLPGLGEPANYGTKFETGVYEEQVKSGYRFPLHPFALRFFEHYRMAPGQLVPNGWRKLAGLIYLVQTSGYKPDVTDFMRVFFEVCFVKGVANSPGWYYIHSRQRLLKGGPKSNKGWHSRYFFVGQMDKGDLPFDKVWNPYCKDFENPGKPTPNSLTKHILSHIKLRGGLCIDEPLSEEQLEWAKMIPPKPIPAGLLIPPLPAIPSVSSAETVPLEMASGGGKPQQGSFLGVLQKAKGKRKEKQPSVELPPAPKRTRVTPSERSPQILDQVSIEDDPIFRPRWALRRDDLGMPDSQISEQHLRHGILPRDKEVFQNQTHETFACSFAQAVYTMYASGSEMFSRFEMARQVAAEEAQLTREAVKEAQDATHRAEELSKREEDHLDRIATLEKKLDRVKKRAAEEVIKARDQGIRDFLEGNAGDEWLKKRTEDGLEIYELGFVKAKEMFADRFPDIPLDGFVLPAVGSPSGETVMPPEAGDVAASDLPGEGPSCDAPEA
ncbi:hypothetical protein RJ640_029999 [Escallonia rubra]|uniref:Uncharacterized protein n=2 Tax=Escallonia rubra TaxID=112253 RepID=A0AA88QQG6_9ASTE|nr:hypothetical protein RJ640_029999 [Escallonia rubra]